MPGLFDRKRPDAAAVRKVKALLSHRFGVSDTTALTVAELRCREPGCPPVETVMTIRESDGRTRTGRLAKPLSEIAASDIEALEVQ